MSLYVRDVLSHPDLNLRVRGGSNGLDRAVRWAHVIELPDPLPWLRGGEMVLTTGLGIPETPAGRRHYLERLATAGCAAVAIALEDHTDARGELLDDVAQAAEALDLPLLQVENPTPFVAVVEAVADHFARERLDQQARLLDAQEAMARAVLSGGLGGVLQQLATSTGGNAVLVNRAGEPENGGPVRPWHRTLAGPRARHRGASIHDDTSDGAQATVLAQGLGVAGGLRLGLRLPGPPTVEARVLANHAASLLVAEFRAAARARRARLHQRHETLTAPSAGAVVFAAVLPAGPFEIVVFPGVTTSAMLDPVADVLPDVLTASEIGSVAVFDVDGAPAVVLPAPGPGRPGAALHAALAGPPGIEDGCVGCSAGDASAVPVAARRARREARTGPGYRDLDAIDPFARLARSLPAASARDFVDDVLGGLTAHDNRHNTELGRTLRAWFAHGGTHAAARTLGVHRNTLRARLRTIERLTGRSTAGPSRFELELALTLQDRLPDTGEPRAR